MREIKFRAWDKQDKRIITHCQDFIPLKVTNFGVLRLNHKIETNNWEFIDENRFYIMQYTGLKDCNGVEIYEVDVVEYFEGEYYNGCYQYQGIIIVDFDIKTLNDLYNSQNLKIIGNIYENPKLSEVK